MVTIVDSAILDLTTGLKGKMYLLKGCHAVALS